MNYKHVMAVGLILLLPVLVRAEVAGVVFTTEPQTIAPGASSATITVQTQNNAGVKENITETADLTFTSTSATGEFLSTSGNPVTTTMSKNSANRNFLYRDSTAGSYTIKVVVTGRTSGQSWQTSQPITVSADAPPAAAGGDSDPDEEPAVSVVGSTATSGGISSSHQSQVALSNPKEKLGLGLSIGRKRQVAVGAGLPFRAVVSGADDAAPIEYHWSFGDGVAAYREVVDHQYAFPGTYNVVATVRQGSDEAVARTVITVVEPVLAIRAGNDGDQAYVELKNNSNYEVNVGNWQLGDSKKKIILPEDTILNSASSVKIPFLTVANQLSLAAPNGRVYAETNTQGAALALLARQLQSLAPPALPVAVSPDYEATVVPVVLETATIDLPPSVSSLPAATATMVELPTDPSWWQRLWHEIF